MESARRLSTLDVIGLRLGKYLGLARMGILEWLAYRLSSIVRLIEFPVIIAVYYFLFTALFRSLPEGEATVGGLSLVQSLTYIALVWLIESLINTHLDWTMGEEVRQGQVAVYLARPLGLIAFYFFQALGHGAYRLVLISGPIALVASMLVQFEVPPSWSYIGLFVLSLAGSFLLMFFLNFLSGLGALFFEFNRGLVVMKHSIVRAFGGLVIPLNLIPEQYREWILHTPFPYMYHVPVQAYLGKLPVEEVAGLVAIEWCWVAGFFIAATWLERLARRMIHIAGG